MNIRTAALAFTFAVGFAGVITANADDAADPILSSFERELNHQPAPATPPQRNDVNDDVLYVLVNQALQSADGESKPASAEASDDRYADDDKFVIAKGE